jgi:hypothetical protein
MDEGTKKRFWLVAPDLQCPPVVPNYWKPILKHRQYAVCKLPQPDLAPIYSVADAPSA